jgi:hypothetical protein
MDILFGTYVCPDHEPEKFGIREEFPKNYVGQLVHPMLPEKVSKKFSWSWKKKHNKVPAEPISITPLSEKATGSDSEFLYS